MSAIYSYTRPDTYIFLRLSSSDGLKLVHIQADAIIDVGKFGSFPANLLIGRPYHYTYELLDKAQGESHSSLKIVPFEELNADILADHGSPADGVSDATTPSANGGLDITDTVIKGGINTLKNNRLTIDDASRQTLTHEEIEQLKRSAGGKEIIEKILAGHSGLDEKTAFAKAKYMLRKTRKYLKRFTVLPMTIGNLIDYVTEKEPSRILEMRQETLALICAWANVHRTIEEEPGYNQSGQRVGGGRWLVADETGGLVSAAMAERIGVLHHAIDHGASASGQPLSRRYQMNNAAAGADIDGLDQTLAKDQALADEPSTKVDSRTELALPSSTNSITILHPAVQPNLSLLKYFGYDTNKPDVNHPLHQHLKPLSYLQLLHPDEDPLYQEPESVPDHTLATWKSNKRGSYWKKRRRWMRCKSIVDETREGGYDGLVIASCMDPVSILAHTLSLVRGGGSVVVYSPTIEPLVQLVDLFSKDRRTAYNKCRLESQMPDADDFPLDPRLLLAPTLQTTRIRPWQALPGRTHPLMTSRGGAEGYIFTAQRVIPVEGGVEARGNFQGRKRKVDDSRSVETEVHKKLQET